MLYLQWLYTLVNAYLCVLKLEAYTMYVSHSIVTCAMLARPEVYFLNNIYVPFLSLFLLEYTYLYGYMLL